MKTVPSTIYDKEYYTKVCLGSKEFKKFKGKKVSKEVKELIQNIEFKKTDHVLDLGCGRGDISLYIARFTEKVIGIDYSKDGIELAKKIKKDFPQTIQRKTQFLQMNATKLTFKDNSFDVVIGIDILEHLNKKEAEKND